MVIQLNNTTLPTSTQVQKPAVQEVASKDVAIKEAVNIKPVENQTEASVTEQKVQAVQVEELEITVNNINDFVQNIQRSIHFSVSETSGRTIIEVYDSETDELIRQIPSEDVQRISEAIADQVKEGLFVKTNI